jgi:hypothetical protein
VRDHAALVAAFARAYEDYVVPLRLDAKPPRRAADPLVPPLR